ncbi:MAG: ORF6N domain-containing protein [Ruminococcus sp.]|nr:ORF6N domain-containing protein [Ruminococcus sp.]
MNLFQITPIEQHGQRVLTTAQIAEAYETTVKVISNNFNRNKDRYIEGIHYYCLKNAELQAFKKTIPQKYEQFKQAKILYLWTERGALLHAKSLNTDKAWEVYVFLLDTYFRVNETENNYVEMILQELEKIKQELKTAEQERKAYKKTNAMILRKLETAEHEREILEQKINIIYQKQEISEKISIVNTENIIKNINNYIYRYFYKKNKK